MASRKHRRLAWEQGHRAFQAAVLRQWRTLAARGPAQFVVGALTGATYGALIATALGALGAVGAALVAGCDLIEVGEHLPLIAFVIVPLLAWALARVPAGIAGIVGAVCTTVPASWAGLEWAVVAGLGAAVGAGVRYERLAPALLGLAGGSVLGGAVGLLHWLAGRQRRLASPARSTWIVYVLAGLLIAAYTWAAIDWAVIF